MPHRIAANIRSSADLGWRPIDFGATGFDAGLIARILEYQRDRILPETGIVDRLTFRTLQNRPTIAHLVKEHGLFKRRYFNHSQGRDLDQPWISAFSGLRIHLPRNVPPPLRREDLPGIPDGAGVVCDVRWARQAAQMQDLRRWGFAWVTPNEALARGVALDVDRWRDLAHTPIGIGISDSTLAAADRGDPWVDRAFDLIQQAAGDLPVAISTRWNFRSGRQPGGRFLRSLRGRSRATWPIWQPHPTWSTAAQVVLTAQSSFLQIGTRIARCFPWIICDDSTNVDHIVRARIFWKSRNMNSFGVSWPPPRHLVDALYGDVPDRGYVPSLLADAGADDDPLQEVEDE